MVKGRNGAKETLLTPQTVSSRYGYLDGKVVILAPFRRNERPVSCKSCGRTGKTPSRRLRGGDGIRRAVGSTGYVGSSQLTIIELLSTSRKIEGADRVRKATGLYRRSDGQSINAGHCTPRRTRPSRRIRPIAVRRKPERIRQIDASVAYPWKRRWTDHDSSR